jgi:hypothetical protein
MFRPVLSIALAGALAVTSLTASATPSKAGSNNDVATVILGAAALYLLFNDHGNGSKQVQYNQGLRKVVPHKCRSVVRIRGGSNRVYARSCLKHKMNGKTFRKLPNACKNSIRTHHGWRTVYKAKCLRRHGWRTS